jgi:hypothetical protein
VVAFVFFTFCLVLNKLCFIFEFFVVCLSFCKRKCFNLAADEESLEPGSQRQYSLVDFELIRVIGRGSYAKVLMVELKKTHRIYAMKVIKKALVTDDEVSKSY